MKRRAVVAMIAASALLISAAVANQLIMSNYSAFVNACGNYPTKACGQQFWGSAADAMEGIANTMQAQINTPSFQGWCANNPVGCQEFYAHWMEAMQAHAHAESVYNFFMSS